MPSFIFQIIEKLPGNGQKWTIKRFNIVCCEKITE